MRRPARAAVMLLCAACAAEGEGNGLASACSVQQASVPLPAELGESSGLALGRRADGVFWTHNDSGGDAAVYAVSAAGELLAKVRVTGAENRDWEDLAAGPCPAGDCLYIADTGDNDAERDDVDIYRIPEPDPGTARQAAAERFRVRYPGGPRDSEAMFVLPSGELFLVTKGRRGPVELFRYPLPLRAGETVELEKVSTLHSPERDELLQVTGADASPSGEWVAVRAYRSLMLFRAGALEAGETEPALVVDLSPVGEAQGEAVSLADDGMVTLTSEGGSKRAPATLARLACTLPS